MLNMGKQRKPKRIHVTYKLNAKAHYDILFFLLNKNSINM